MSDLPRSPELMNRDDSRLLIVDMQERLLPHIDGHDAVIENCVKLVQGADVLGVPTTATEQYPKGLGPTTPALAELLPERPKKLDFSCLECLDWATTASVPESRFRIVVVGIEAHVCVQQTVHDLLANGFRVYVAADAVSSRKPFDRDTALQRMASAGATITTTESILFEWCQRAGSDEFKAISQLVK